MAPASCIARARYRHAVVLLVLLVFTTRAAAQRAEYRTEGFRTTDSMTVKKLVGMNLVSLVLFGSLVDSYFAWWKDSHHSFTIEYDNWFNIDKLGHFQTSYTFFHSFRNLMLWSGFDGRTAYWWGMGLATLFGLTIEVGDGFSEYGFGMTDLVYDLAGVGYGMLQVSVPFLRNFKPKFGYHPADGYQVPAHFSNHYRDHTYWIAIDLHNLLPRSLQSYWPAFLQPAVGYGMDGWVQTAPGVSHEVREIVFGLDFNFGAFRLQNEELLLLQKEIDLFHLPPLPAVKFTEHKEPEYKLLYLR